MRFLEVKNLSIVDMRTKAMIIDDVSFTLAEHECLGIVGESGSGKSMTVKAMLGLIEPWLCVTGSALFKDEDLLQLPMRNMRSIRGRLICMIFQDAMAAFDPLYTIGYQLIETLEEKMHVSKKEAKQRILIELEKVGIKQASEVLQKYPHQLSGGMLQRCMIAIAVAIKPDMIIADEPTTALDAITQREVIHLLHKLKDALGISLIFISHDLGVVQHLAEHVLVMKEGRQMEYGRVDDVFKNPTNAYTKYLIHTRKQLTYAFERAIRKDNPLC